MAVQGKTVAETLKKTRSLFEVGPGLLWNNNHQLLTPSLLPLFKLHTHLEKHDNSLT